MPDMMSMINNLLAPLPSDGVWTVYQIVSLVLLVLMIVAAIAAVLIVLFQPGNSTGIDGSSETFFGKNKGRSKESRMKKWTVICLIVLTVLAIAFFILQFDTIWGVAA